MKGKLKSAKFWLIIALLLIFVGSGIAYLFNTSFGNVTVSRIKFETESGELSGLLYMPKGAGEESPRPTIVTAHGYLNSAEMQDAPAIEMSRRGYVVLALDMYDHGHSKATLENTGKYSFWLTSIWDAVKYMYDQDYVLKDDDGTGIIAVSGHSMGGFSSTMALHFDELEYQATGVQRIIAGLSAGSDFSYTASMGGLDVGTACSEYRDRVVGKIAAHYDEFFFNNGTEPGSVSYKDYVQTEEGQTFLGNPENPEAGVFYDTSDGGERIIYTPYQTHPWNHFSKETTGYMIDFYDVAFADYQVDGMSSIDSSDQIWMGKEAFECIALIGFFLLIVPLVLVIARIPAFKSVKVSSPEYIEEGSGFSGKVGKAILLLFSIFIPAFFFPGLYNGNMGSEDMNILMRSADLIAIVAGISVIYILVKKQEEYRRHLAPMVLTLIAAVGMHIFMAGGFFKTSAVFQGPTVNSIVLWAVVCGLITTILLSLQFVLGEKKKKGYSLSYYGMRLAPKGIALSLIIAVIVVVVLYVLLFIVDALWKVDFRIWVLAAKTFEGTQLTAALKYMPFFFIYFLALSAAIAYNINTMKSKGAKQYLLGAALAAGGILVFALRQYITLFATGVGAHPTFSLGSILLIALIPSLAVIGAIIAYITKKLGNIWVAAFISTILMTIINVANTTIYFQMV